MREAPRSTLFGVATGTPDGGVAVVRISGPAARAIGEALVGSLPEARRLGRRAIAAAGGSEDGLVVWMPGPRSFTGEDVVELHVHAGARNVEAVCRAVAAAGGTAAGPGDFSRRAFELGRLGLDEAEGLAAVIGAQTDAALEQARRLAAGELGREVEGLRARIIGLTAEIEANLDFPEDVEPGSTARWCDELEGIAEEVRRWLARFEAGRRARSKPRVVLAGPVNAGKSTLFNALLGRDRALVADTPGTTRDYVEADLELGLHVVTLVDTAGLRTTDESVERAGIDRTGDQIAGADIVLWCEPADEAGVSRPTIGSTVVEVKTKADRRGPTGDVQPSPARQPPVVPAGSSVEARAREDVSVRGGEVAVSVTAAGSAGLGELREAIAEWFAVGRDAPWIGLQRHRDRAAEASRALDEAEALLADADRLELAAFALTTAAQRLGEITGRVQTGALGEEVLREIFARFCIGK